MPNVVGLKRISGKRFQQSGSKLHGSRLNFVKGSKATAIYHDIAQALDYPVEVVSLWIQLFWVLVFVSIAVALASYLETVYSPKSLGRWVNELKRKEALLAGARRNFQHMALAPSLTSSPHPKESDSTAESSPVVLQKLVVVW